jgi:hypothetical protein
MTRLVLMLALITALFLAGCSNNEAMTDNLAELVADDTAASQPPAADNPTADILPNPAVSSDEPVPAATANIEVSLTTAHDDALSIEGQLALGTLRLEDGDLAVDEVQAVALLPLWEALLSLRNSDITASAELAAVVGQIERTMTPAQLAAIAAMQLTTQTLAELELEGGGFGRLAGRGAGVAEGGTQGRSGGLPGSGAGGGMGRGFPGSGAGTGVEVDEAFMATRQAERDSGTFQQQALTFSVIRLLQTKTGDVPQTGSGSVASTILTAIAAEIGIGVDDIQNHLEAGTSIVEIIEAAGGDVEQVRTALVSTLSQLENAAELDVEGLVDRWLAPPEEG